MKKYISLLLLAFAINAFSQSGIIDPTFGVDGKVTTGFGSNSNAANGIAFQPDGKFLVGGTYISAHGENDFALTRHNADGTLDFSFGIQGKAVTNFNEINNDYSYIHTIYVRPDGKIVVFGTTGMQGFFPTVGIVRYNTNGTIDTTFGNNGKIISELIPFDTYGNKLIFGDDGTFLMTSMKLYQGDPNYYIGIEKYSADGILDTTFGNNGQIVTTFATGKSAPSTIVRKPDGKFIIAGVFRTTGSYQMSVAQFNANGTLDTGFNGTGKAIVNFGTATGAEVMQALVSPDGKITLAGIAYNTVRNFALVRYNANGTLDTTFDGDGKALAPFPVAEAQYTITAVGCQPDGKYVAIFNANDGATTSNFVVRRYHADATNDITFGTSGIVSTSFGLGFNDGKSATAGPNGKLFIVGKSQAPNYGNTDFAIAKYNDNGTLDTTLHGDGKLKVAMEFGDDLCSHLLVLPNDKLVAIGTTEYVQANNATFKNIALSKYNSDGSADTTFGNAGKVVSVFGDHYNRITAVGLQPDGKIVLANVYAAVGTSDYHYELIRYLTDGTLDNSFGTNGKIAIGVYTNSFVFQADGKIVVAGTGTTDNITFQYELIRYNSNGTLDTGFGTNGQQFISFGAQNFGEAFIKLQPDQKLVLSGTSTDPDLFTGAVTFATARINPNGSIDTTFGDNGKILALINDGCIAYANFIQPDGKIIVAGKSFNGGTYFSAIRYNANGTTDTTYATAGIASFGLFGNYYNINNVLLQADGKFLVALGYVPNGNPIYNKDFKIRRFNPDNPNNSDFGDADGATMAFYNFYDEAFALGLQSDDKVVAAGATNNGINFEFALTRFTNSILAVDHFDEEQPGLVVYPNPASNMLHIKTSIGATEILGYHIYNMLGQMVGKNFDGGLDVDTSSLSNGLYNLVMKTSQGIVSKKFVKE